MPNEFFERVPQSTSLAMFRQTCLNRHFEFNLKKVYDTGIIKMPIYLSLGEEHISAALAQVYPDCMIFRQHRGHSTYLSYGGDPIKLIDEMLLRPTGCSGGKGGSSHLHCKEINYYGHCGLIGNEVSIGIGASFASGKRSLIFIGDAAIEEDYVLSVIGFAAKYKTPTLFIGEDNNLSILTEVKVRRDWNAVPVFEAFGVPSIEIDDDPWRIMDEVKSIMNAVEFNDGGLPNFINIHTCRAYWHAGTGQDGQPKWNRFEMMKQVFVENGLGKEIEDIENESKIYMDQLWEKQLLKQ